MLTSKDKLDIIKGSLSGEVNEPAYIAIKKVEEEQAVQQAEQEAQQAQQGETAVEPPQEAPTVQATGGTAAIKPTMPHTASSGSPHLINSASSLDIGFNQASGTSRGKTSLGTQGSYKKGGIKYEDGGPGTELSMCSNGEWNGGSVKTACGNRNSAHNLYGSGAITLGDISDKTMSGSVRAGLGYSTHVPYSPITGHLGLSGGSRFKMDEHSQNFKPIFDATGSIGMEGEFGGNSHNWREPWKYGAGVYGKQDLTGGTGTTVGLYGNVGKFSGKVGYNRNTGPEATIGFGLPIRKKGGFKYENGGPKRPTSKADIKELQNHLLSEGFKLPKFGADGSWGEESQIAYDKYTNRTKTNSISMWDRVKGAVQKVNPMNISQSAASYAQYMGNALLQGTGLVGQDESYFDVDENDLRSDELGAYKSMLRQNLNKGKKGKIDYREYSNDAEINNAPNSEAARKKLRGKGIGKTLLKDWYFANSTNSTKEALHGLTGNANYTIDDDGNVHVQDNYDFNYSQNKKTGPQKAGTTLGEIWNTVKNSKMEGLYQRAHEVGDHTKSSIPVDISLGSATDMGLSPQEIASLGKYTTNKIKTVGTWDLMKRAVGFEDGGFKDGDGTENTDTIPNLNLRQEIMDYMHRSGRDTNQVKLVQEYIATQESNNNPSKKQLSQNKETKEFFDGPGRGKYQFEMGKKQGANTALNSAVLFLQEVLGIDPVNTKYKGYENIHKFYSQKGENTDFSTFTEKEQDAIFLAQSIYDGSDKRDDFNTLVKNNKRGVTSEGVYEYWLKHHKVKSTEKDERKRWDKRTKSVKTKIKDDNKNNISDFIERPKKNSNYKKWGLE